MAGFVYFVTAGKNSQADKETVNLKPPQNETQNKNFESRINDEGGVSIEVTPINFESGKQIQFEIAFTTHQGSLDFDLMQKSVLIDSLGNTYLPLEWQGGRGGHHLSGTLIFSPLKEGIKQFKLVIKNIYDVSERIFEWNLK